MEQRIGKIVLYQRLDRATLQAMLTAGDNLILDVERRYVVNNVPDSLGVTLPAAWPSVDIDFTEALVNVIEAAAWSHEQDCLVWNVAYDADAKIFDLNGSYLRDSIDTGACTPMANNEILLAAFSTPGFPRPVITVLRLSYDNALDPAEVAALNAVGLELSASSTASLFSLKSQRVQFTVSFYRPEDALKNYVINFPLADQIIEI